MLIQQILSLCLLCYHGVTATSSTPHLEDHSISVRPPHVQDNTIALPAQSASSPLQPRDVPVYFMSCYGDRNKRSHCLMNCKCRNYSRGQVSCGVPNAESTRQVKRYLSQLRATCPLLCKCVKRTDLHSQSPASGLRGSPNSRPPVTYASVTRSGLSTRNVQEAPVKVEDSSFQVRNASLYNPSVDDGATSVSSPHSLEPRSVPKYRIHCATWLSASIRLNCLISCQCKRDVRGHREVYCGDPNLQKTPELRAMVDRASEACSRSQLCTCDSVDDATSDSA